MAESFASLLSTPLFTFNVGADGEATKDFAVHSGVIAAQSKQLSALMTGTFSEKFAYTGSYAVQPPAPAPASELEFERGQFVCDLRCVFDHGALHDNQVSLYQNGQQYSWRSVDQAGSLDLNKVVGAKFGNCHFRLEWKSSRGRYDHTKRIVFMAQSDCLSFRKSVTEASGRYWRAREHGDKELKAKLESDVNEAKRIADDFRENWGAKLPAVGCCLDYRSDATSETSEVSMGDFFERKFTVDGLPTQGSASKSLPPTSSPSRGLGPVLSAHAKVYIFAEQRLARMIQQAAINRLHALLKLHELDAINWPDIRDLIRLVFHGDSLPDKSIRGNIEPLKELLVHYMVTQMDDFGSRPSFQEFVGEGGPFVALFWGIYHKANMES